MSRIIVVSLFALHSENVTYPCVDIRVVLELGKKGVVILAGKNVPARLNAPPVRNLVVDFRAEVCVVIRRRIICEQGQPQILVHH